MSLRYFDPLSVRETFLDVMPRQAEDEPDYLKELLAQAGIDAQASSVAAKLQEVIIGELHHRVKNTLAIVSAITSQSLRTANSLEEATKTIADRLHALGVAQDLLVSERWTGAGCRTLIEHAVKAFQSKGLESVLSFVGKREADRRYTSHLEGASVLGLSSRRYPANCRVKLALGLNWMA